MDEPDPDLYRQRRLLIAALALTALCTQLLAIMALPAEKEKERADWNETETAQLVDYLWEHRAEAGDGGAFKAQTVNAAVKHIAPYLTAGPVKNAKSVKTKIKGVSYYDISQGGSLLTLS